MSDTNNANQTTLYVVRLRPSFRFHTVQPDGKEVLHTNEMQAAFLSHEAACVFAGNSLPTNKNPFALDVYFVFVVSDGIIHIHHWEVDDDGFDDGGKDKHRPSVNLGALMMVGDSETALSDFVALCRQIGVTPPDLGENANLTFRDFDDTDEQQADVWQKTLTDGLRQWWENQKDAMTTALKETIWRKLHPRPYEIVPVPMAEEE